MALPGSGELREMTMTTANLARRFSGLARSLARETDGTEIAEAAAVLPLLFMIILGIFWFGQAFSIYGTITRAAQEGARAGAAPYCTTCNATNTTAQYATNAVNAVKSVMTLSKLDPNLAQYPSPQPSFNACGGGVGGTSCIGSASGKICVQTPVQFSNPGPSGATGVCGISVSFRYPFAFKLPFTNLNNRQIWLTAQARVHMETQ